MSNHQHSRSLQYMTAVYVTLGMAIGSYSVNHWFLPMLPAQHESADRQQGTSDEKAKSVCIHFIQ